MEVNPYRYREGLSARPVASSEEVQVRIDPLQADFDQEILGLHKLLSLRLWIRHSARLPIGKLPLLHVAKEIEAETGFQDEIVSDLQRLLSNAEASVKNGMRRLNRTVSRRRSNHVLQVILFGLVLFFVVYLWSEQFRR